MNGKFASLLIGILGAVAAVAGPGTAAADDSPRPAVGAPAPAFTLPDQEGRQVSLSQFKGKWVVLYFYPKDNTPGCTTEACEFRDNMFAFRNANAVILGISVDDVASHKDFAKEHSLPFPLLADSAKNVARSYGVLHRMLGLMEIARRETFLIDPMGRIAKHYEDVTAKGHSQAVLADLRTIQTRQKTLTQGSQIKGGQT